MTLQMHPHGHIIGGKPTTPIGGETVAVKNPATGEVIAQMPKGTRGR